ncbi:MAG TPA: ion transporter, partial [Beutenbergiaceae bacterium]|nr:ion transporter [Beutenbergiaceae bacterium]
MMKRIAHSSWFSTVIMWVILANAAVFAAASYNLPAEVELWLERAETVFLGIYAVEMVIRLAAYRFNLVAFFKSPFRIFELGIVAAAFLPFVTSQIVLLRLVRLFRVARLIRYMPDFRILVDGLKRALPPTT